jgi:putative endonuclease
LHRRVWEHKHRKIEGFTRRYRVHRLVYYEETSNPEAAIEREKQIKGLRRSKKLALIRSMNPEFVDFSKGWFDEE